MAELGFTPGRVEVLVTSGVSARDRLLARSVDAIVSRAGGAALAGCPVSFLARARDPDIGGPPIDVCLVPEGRRRRYTAVPVAAAMLRSSSNAEDLPVVVDGRLDVNWKTAERGTSDEWVEVDLGAPWLLGRVELLLGRRPNRAGRHLRLFVAEEGGAWRSIAFVQGRPPVEDQHAVAEGEASEELLLEPVRARGVRIVARSRPRQRWGFAELRLSALEPP
jgi:hypothetical protein